MTTIGRLFDINSYNYPLDESRIAQSPAIPRDSSKLMVWNPSGGNVEHRLFRDITEYLRPDDLLVLNDTRVIPARIFGTRRGGGSAEILLLRPETADFTVWRSLVRPGRKLRKGAEVSAGDRTIRIEEQLDDGMRIVRVGDGRADVLAFLDKFGHVPLPPYIHAGDEWRKEYQTVFAKQEGSAAAPTASLHFTPELLERIEASGVRKAWVTLHVGLGTFLPVKTDDIRQHVIHEEHCELPEDTVRAVEECRARGGCVIASGTTVVRTLESMADEDGRLRSGPMETRLFIYPGFKFNIVDAMITNFHLPCSSLLMLVSSFVEQTGKMSGEDALTSLLARYEEAQRLGYRFFSFGDAMFISSRT